MAASRTVLPALSLLKVFVFMMFSFGFGWWCCVVDVLNLRTLDDSLQRIPMNR